MFDTALGDHGLNTAVAQRASMPLGVVTTIGVDHTRSAQWMAAQSANRWNRVDQRQQLRDIVDIRAGQDHGERRAVGVGDDVVLGTRSRAIGRVWPAPTARIDDESTVARENSIWSAARSLVSSNSCKRSHTPAACQSLSRRQHVTPEPQPISAGRSRQRSPVSRTNWMPVSAARFETGRRPGFRCLSNSSPRKLTAPRSLFETVSYATSHRLKSARERHGTLVAGLKDYSSSHTMADLYAVTENRSSDSPTQTSSALSCVPHIFRNPLVRAGFSLRRSYQPELEFLVGRCDATAASAQYCVSRYATYPEAVSVDIGPQLNIKNILGPAHHSQFQVFYQSLKTRREFHCERDATAAVRPTAFPVLVSYAEMQEDPG